MILPEAMLAANKVRPFSSANRLRRPALLARMVAPATIRKHTEHLLAKFPGEVVYVRDRVAAYQRKRLIGQRVPFIVPGNQLYLPSFGIDLREFYRSQLRETPDAFSPATQAVLLYLLLRAPARPHTPNELAKRLGYSKMSMSRVLRELEGRPFARTETVGRNRLLTIADDRQRVRSEALPFLRNPATKRCHVSRPNNTIGGVTAGLSALSHYTMLSTAPQMTFAERMAAEKVDLKSLGLANATQDEMLSQFLGLYVRH